MGKLACEMKVQSYIIKSGKRRNVKGFSEFFINKILWTVLNENLENKLLKKSLIRGNIFG